MSRDCMNRLPARASAYAWTVVGWLWVVALSGLFSTGWR